MRFPKPKALKKAIQYEQKPINYTRINISLRDFSDQLELFLRFRLEGGYEIGYFMRPRYRALHVSVEGFAQFVKYNFCAAAETMQIITVSTEIEGEDYRVCFWYDTTDINGQRRQNMKHTASLSGFKFEVFPDRVVAHIHAIINCVFDIAAISKGKKQVLHDALMHEFFECDPIFVFEDDQTHNAPIENT
jgi:hypothetical protein